MIQAAVVASVFTPLFAALCAFGTYIVIQGAPRRWALAWLAFLASLLALGGAAAIAVVAATLLR